MGTANSIHLANSECVNCDMSYCVTLSHTARLAVAGLSESERSRRRRPAADGRRQATRSNIAGRARKVVLRDEWPARAAVRATAFRIVRNADCA